MTTRIYLDIDGVLNIIALDFPDTWDTWEKRQVHGYPIRFSQELIDSINEISERDDVEFVWLTTWQDLAVSEFSPKIGVNGQDWRVLYDETRKIMAGNYAQSVGQFHEYTWWKLVQIHKDLQENPVEKFVWIDDDYKNVAAAAAWVNELQDEKVPPLVISPYEAYGLTPADIRDIIDFINSER